MSTRQEAYHGRTPGILDELVRLNTPKFLHFSRHCLQIPEKTLQAALKTADLSDEAKYQMVQDSYQKDRKEFLQRQSRHVHNVLTNVQPNGTPPDWLPAKCVYNVIDDQKSTDKVWTRYAAEDLKFEFDKTTIDLSAKVLSDDQKYALLHGWGRNGGSVEEVEEELTRRFEQFRGNRAF